MFAPPQLIETEVFAAVPQNLRKSHVPAERIFNFSTLQSILSERGKGM